MGDGKVKETGGWPSIMVGHDLEFEPNVTRVFLPKISDHDKLGSLLGTGRMPACRA